MSLLLASKHETVRSAAQASLRTAAPELSAAEVDSTATLIAELVVCIQDSQEARAGVCHKDVSIAHSVAHQRGADNLWLSVDGVESLDLLDLDRLRRFGGPYLIDVDFQFIDENSGEPLTSGVVLFNLLVRGEAQRDASASRRGAELKCVYSEPDERAKRKPLVDYDWSDSVVAPLDRPLVVDIIGRVYNMYALMPSEMRVFLEPIDCANYTTAASRQVAAAAAAAQRHRAAASAALPPPVPGRGRKRGSSAKATAAAAVEDDVAPASSALGYTLHFSGVPEFSEAFLRHLESVAGKRLVAAVVVFPHQRLVPDDEASKEGAVLLETSPAELLVSLSRQGTTETAKQYALMGSKRLCNKIYNDAEQQGAEVATAVQ